MSRLLHEPKYRGAASDHAVLELTVRNHAGVMSHICGLFSRRGYNMDGILCLPIGDGQRSRIWIRVAEDARLDQVISQTQKLEDVLDIRRHAADHAVFTQVEAFFRE